MTARVPFVDLGWQHAVVEKEVRAGFDDVMAATSFVDGPPVAAFESSFAEYSKAAVCVGVGNGTDAIEFALRATGIGRDDEVVIPANTFIATAEAVTRIGATPVLVDCDDDALLLDPVAAVDAINERTRAVVGVHLYGQIAPLEQVVIRAAEVGAAVIEDAAQAQGATRGGLTIGSWGAAAPTSFYPGKNLGAYGDAGAVLTQDREIAERVRRMRSHGSTTRYIHDEFGCTSRLDTLQAVVLNAKLAHLDEWNALREEAAARYVEMLGSVDGVRLPSTLPGNRHVWHLFVVRVAERDRVVEELQSSGVGAAVHYPVPVHLHGAYRHLGLGRGSFPVAERAAGEILSLPMFPGITAAQQERVAEVLVGAVTAS